MNTKRGENQFTSSSLTSARFFLAFDGLPFFALGGVVAVVLDRLAAGTDGDFSVLVGVVLPRKLLRVLRRPSSLFVSSIKKLPCCSWMRSCIVFRRLVCEEIAKEDKDSVLFMAHPVVDKIQDDILK